MLFSTLKNQSKASEMVQKAHETIQKAAARIEQAKERFVEAVSRSDSVRERLGRKGIVKFENILKQMRNEPPVELPPLSDTLFFEQAQPLMQIGDTQAPTVTPLVQKRGRALFAAFLAALVTVAAALILAALATGQSLSVALFTQADRLEAMLAWIGGGAYDPAIGNPLFGAIGIATAALAAAVITWSVVMSNTSRRNLQSAKGSLAAAESYAEEMERTADTMERLTTLLEAYRKEIEICDAFLDEYNASLRRILLTEGDDYDKFSQSSQRRVAQAVDTASSIVPLLNITILTTENGVAAQLETAVDEARQCVRKLMEGSGAQSITNEKADKGDEESTEPIILGYSHSQKEGDASPESDRPEEERPAE